MYQVFRETLLQPFVGLQKFAINNNRFITYLSLYLTVVCNFPLLIQFYKALFDLEFFNWLFALSFPVLLFSLLHIFLSLLDFKYLIKPLAIALVLIGSTVTYAEYNYSVLFNYGMIENIFQTSSSEAQMYVNSMSILWVLITGIIPSLVILNIKIKYGKPLKFIGNKVAYLAITVTLFSGILLVFYKSYASFGRNNKEFVHMITPLNVITNSIKYLDRTYFYTTPEYKTIAQDASIVATESINPKLFVLLVGETSRAKNHNYYGYSRQTNAYTEDESLLVFNDVSSCGTATAISVPCMFSLLKKDDFSTQSARNQDNVLDILNRLPINVEWLDNDGTCKDVCNDITHVFFDPKSNAKLCDGKYCYDQILIDNLQKTINKYSENNKDTVIVLHLVGSHGPTYYRRYPSQFKIFIPDCPRSDIQNCTEQKLVNTYDNTILYTDYIYDEAIKIAKDNEGWDSSVMYVSDHGESLGENGFYLHGIPYAIAPKEQTQIPMYLWLSDSYMASEHMSRNCLKRMVETGHFSHDNVFHTVLGMMNVSTEVYQPELDVLSSCEHSIDLEEMGLANK